MQTPPRKTYQRLAGGSPQKDLGAKRGDYSICRGPGPATRFSNLGLLKFPLAIYG